MCMCTRGISRGKYEVRFFFPSHVACDKIRVFIVCSRTFWRKFKRPNLKMQNEKDVHQQQVKTCDQLRKSYMKTLGRMMQGGFQYDLNKLEQDRKDFGYAHDNRHDRFKRNLEIDEAHYAAHMNFADYLYAKCMNQASVFTLPPHRLFT